MENPSVEDVFSFLEDSDLHEVAVIFKGECFHFNFFSTSYLFYNVLKYVQYVLELKIMHYQHGFARFANIDICVFRYKHVPELSAIFYLAILWTKSLYYEILATNLDFVWTFVPNSYNFFQRIFFRRRFTLIRA